MTSVPLEAGIPNAGEAAAAADEARNKRRLTAIMFFQRSRPGSSFAARPRRSVDPPNHVALIDHKLGENSALESLRPVMPGYAGPCTEEIGRMQARVDAMTEVVAAAGPTARESTAVDEHPLEAVAAQVAEIGRRIIGHTSSGNVSSAAPPPVV